MIFKIKKLVNKILSYTGYQIIKINKKIKINKSNKVNLNIGSGNTIFENFINLDKSSVSYKQNKNYLEYDITKDKLNYNNSSVDNIYVSHVIEHLEDEVVKNFFIDSLKKLKKNGVLRICCPDASFLFEVSSFSNNYWKWRERWFVERNISLKQVSQIDFLIQEISTRYLRFFDRNNEKIYEKIKQQYEYNYTMNLLTSNQKFNQKLSSDHINYFDFKKIKNFLIDASVKNQIDCYKILNSKPGGSVSEDMQSEEFDKTKPQMSLYVEYIKLN